MAALVSYAACQSACSGGWVACYSTAGLVAGTVTAGVGAPAAALVCNAACGACMKVCASKFLAEGAAETAATGGVIGPINLVGGAVVAAGGWFGRAAIARAAGAVASRLAAAGATGAAGSGAGAGAAAGGAAAGTAFLPVVITAASVISVGAVAYKGYQWWKAPQFPTNIQVTVLAGSHANKKGNVVGMAAGDVVVDPGDGRGLLRVDHGDLDLTGLPHLSNP